MISVAIIFDNLGPYHLARLRAASSVCALTAIEVAGKSAVYAWNQSGEADGFQRRTLIEHGTSSTVSRHELQARLERVLDEIRPDAVLVPGWATHAAWGAMEACARRNIPAIGVSESTAWDEPRRPWKEWIKRRLIRFYSSALVGGERHRDYLVQLGFPAERIFLGYDAVDNNYFAEKAAAARASAEEVRRRHGLPERYFLASARFVEKKNLSNLLTAFARYRLTCAWPWSLVLLGDGPLRPALEAQVRQMGVESSILMPGFLQYDVLPDYYALARVFIHASTIEPWGLVVNEAMACGLPVLAAKPCGCVPELVHDGKNGFTFDPRSIDEMAAAMKRIAGSDFPRADFGRASTEIVAQWGADRFAQGCMDAVKEALTRGPARPGAMERAALGLVRWR
jgi:glycosyltransferase involved in cell wall biosynthesis